VLLLVIVIGLVEAGFDYEQEHEIRERLPVSA
jgi:hypothetical protein